MPGRFRDTLVVLSVGCLVTPSLTQGHEPSHQDTITRKIEDPVSPPMAGRGVHSRHAYSLPDRGNSTSKFPQSASAFSSASLASE